MKHTLLVPIRFLLVTIVVLLVVTLLAAAADQGRGAGEQESGVETSFLESLLFELPVTFPASVLAAVLLELFLILRKPGVPALSLLLLLITAAALQFGGTFLFQGEKGRAESRDLGLYRDDLLLENRSYTFAFREREGSALIGVFLSRPDAEPRVSVHPEGFLDLQGERLLLPTAGVELPLRDEFSPYAVMFEPPSEATRFVEDVRYFSQDLRTRLQEGVLQYAPAVAASTLLFVSFWTLARATSWKLFNVLLVLLAGRLFFLLYRLLNSAFVREISVELLPAPVAGFLPSLVLVALALFLLLIALLMPSIREWKRGVGDA